MIENITRRTRRSTIMLDFPIKHILWDTKSSWRGSRISNCAGSMKGQGKVQGNLHESQKVVGKHIIYWIRSFCVRLKLLMTPVRSLRLHTTKSCSRWAFHAFCHIKTNSIKVQAAEMTRANHTNITKRFLGSMDILFLQEWKLREAWLKYREN